MLGYKMVQKSLLTKLMAVLTIAMVLIAIIVSAVTYSMTSSKLKKGFDNDVEAMIALTNSSLHEAVFAYDYQQVEAVAKSLVNTDMVTSISVNDQRGQSLAREQDDDRSEGQITHDKIDI